MVLDCQYDLIGQFLSEPVWIFAMFGLVEFNLLVSNWIYYSFSNSKPDQEGGKIKVTYFYNQIEIGCFTITVYCFAEKVAAGRKTERNDIQLCAVAAVATAVGLAAGAGAD